MPTKYQRIAVTVDPALAEALAKVAPYVDGKPKAATLVHDLAVRGAEALAQNEERRREAIERLIRMSVNREGLDWDLLDRIDEEAWGIPPGSDPHE